MAFSPLVKKRSQSVIVGVTPIIYTGILVIELLDNVFDANIFINSNDININSRTIIHHFGGTLTDLDRLCPNGTSFIFAGQSIFSNRSAIAHIFEVS